MDCIIVYDDVWLCIILYGCVLLCCDKHTFIILDLFDYYY